jgi:hypothetical protein
VLLLFDEVSVSFSNALVVLLSLLENIPSFSLVSSVVRSNVSISNHKVVSKEVVNPGLGLSRLCFISVTIVGLHQRLISVSLELLLHRVNVQRRHVLVLPPSLLFDVINDLVAVGI